MADPLPPWVRTQLALIRANLAADQAATAAAVPDTADAAPDIVRGFANPYGGGLDVGSQASFHTYTPASQESDTEHDHDMNVVAVPLRPQVPS